MSTKPRSRKVIERQKGSHKIEQEQCWLWLGNMLFDMLSQAAFHTNINVYHTNHPGKNNM